MVALWWPIRTFWQSDDWIAVHYAADLGRALHDFTGNQYDLPGMVWFYRPLITLSFALEHLIGGGDPFVSHLSNALAHGLSALLLGLLANRFAGAWCGWGAALVWAAAPLHAGSVLWAVGRVDSHTSVWILLCSYMTVRACDGHRGARPLSLLAFVLALMSKELALAVPGVVFVLCYGMAPSGKRLRRALWGTWPFVLLLGLYLGGRVLVLGHVIGGYQGGLASPGALVLGLGEWTLRILNPLWIEGSGGADLPGIWRWLGFLPAIGGVVVLLARRRAGLLACLGLLFVGCSLPAMQFWSDTDNLQNLRYFTLPFAALAVLLAAGGVWTALPALAVFALPHLEVRRDYLETFDAARRMHRRLVTEAAELEPGPLFVAGLPETNAKGNVVAFHLGVDRLLKLPFATTPRRVLALRPLGGARGTFQIPYGDPAQPGLPEGITACFVGPEIWTKLTALRGHMQVRIEGPSHLSSRVLWDFKQHRASSWLLMQGVRAPRFRITIFTAGGYLTAVLDDEAAPSDRDGRVSLQSWLSSPYRQDGRAVLMDLPHATTLDLSTRFPVLVEAGKGAVNRFEVRQTARHFVWVTFDRDLAELVAQRVPDPR